MNSDAPLPNDWSAQVTRAYAVFGVDPLDGADEFGFRFPKLSVTFLREKAERQLRDVLGRWRKMRGRIDVDSSADRIERANLQRSVPDIDRLTIADVSSLRSRDRIELLLEDEETLKAIVSNYEKNPKLFAESRFSTFFKPKEYDEESMRNYIARSKYEWAKYLLDRESATMSYWLQEANNYEHGFYGDRPILAGTPEERVEMIPAFGEYLKKLEERKTAEKEQRNWDRTHLSLPKGDHDKITAAGHNDPPTIVPMAEFDAVEGYTIPEFIPGEAATSMGFDPDRGTILFRGKTGSSMPSKDIMASAQYAAPEDHYVGHGIYGNGLYFGDLGTALGYASHPSARFDDLSSMMTEDGSIIAAKIRTDATVLKNYEAAQMAHKIFMEIVSDPDEIQDAKIAKLKSIGLSRYGDIEVPELFAAANGIDVVINLIGSGGEQNIVVFNRGALIMPDYGLVYTPRQKDPRPEVPPEPLRPPGIRLRDDALEDLV